MGAFPLAFTSPLILSALLLLPVIWWLLRLTPPRPRQVAFPPTRLLLDIDKHEETPQRSPWWLTLLRLLLAALVIIALAGPIWRPAQDAPVGDGPLWLLIDNGWTSTRGWDDQVRTAEHLLDGAATRGNPVLLVATADGPAQPMTPTTAAAALERLRALDPRPYDRLRAELVTGLRKAARDAAPGAVIWLSDGLEDASEGLFQQDLAALAGGAPITVYDGLPVPRGLKALSNDADALSVTAVRSEAGQTEDLLVSALDLKGLVLGEVSASFSAGETETVAEFTFPAELRNDIARVEIKGERAAGAVQLLDDSWRRRTVGLIAGSSGDLAQPLLSPIYYLERALSPFADLRVPRSNDLIESVPGLLDQGISVMVLADVGRLPEPAADALADWIDGGGVLIRFAGPRTAGGTDELIPVSLRAGDRSLGGSLSWKQPQKLASFTPTSPFAGLAVPPEVTVTRQVLAEPTAELPEKTWAMLEDGTPLVTATIRGKGSLVLFHVTADSGWSNLPLSGTFVHMLRRIIAYSSAAPAQVDAGDAAEDRVQNVLPPLRLLDGFGRFVSPPSDVTPVSAADFAELAAGRKAPPGLYGTDDGFRVLNLMRETDTLALQDLERLPETATVAAYPTRNPVDMRAALFVLVFTLLLLDAVAVILLAGGLSRLRLRRAAVAGVAGIGLAVAFGLLSGLAGSGSALAQATPDDVRALEAATNTRLAYVLTGAPDIDDASEAGLRGLSQFLRDRTALEPGDPMSVDIARDELAFFSLLYWPVDPSMDKPDARTLARIDTFMRNGGTILFDTRDHITAATTGFGTTPATLKLREILEDLDVPPLEPVPADHVLTKAFYLLDSFPGRYATSPLWVESMEQTAAQSGRPVRGGDGVSPVLITGNDFAAAWAIDENGEFLYPTVPNDAVQRDYALRSGVNIVMYSFTGNYKADQVHIPALLERLGQ